MKYCYEVGKLKVVLNIYLLARRASSASFRASSLSEGQRQVQTELHDGIGHRSQEEQHRCCRKNIREQKPGYVCILFRNPILDKNRRLDVFGATDHLLDAGEWGTCRAHPCITLASHWGYKP